MRQAAFFKMWAIARRRVAAEITARSQGGDMYARGLSSEGYHGGYLQALDDIDAVLRHGYPNDPGGFWLPEQTALRELADALADVEKLRRKE